MAKVSKVKLVVIESPYAGDVERNLGYLAACLKDSINRGEAPFASHAIYPLCLDDSIREERVRGIVCGYHWMAQADLVAAYTDLGISEGMKAAIDRAGDLNKTVEYRKLENV
jgi:hypothetical protein